MSHFLKCASLLCSSYFCYGVVFRPSDSGGEQRQQPEVRFFFVILTERNTDGFKVNARGVDIKLARSRVREMGSAVLNINPEYGAKI